jgi:hypothetical protein
MQDIQASALRNDAAEDLIQAEFQALRRRIGEHIIG